MDFLKSKDICKNCGHLIIKWKEGFRHKCGGSYCKKSYDIKGNPILGGCLCNKAEPNIGLIDNEKK